MARVFFDRLSAGKIRFSSESEIAEEIASRSIPSVIIGPRGVQGASIPGDKGVPGESIPGDKGITGESIPGDKGVQGESIVGDKGIQGESIVGDKGVQGESIPGDKAITGESIPGDKGPIGESIVGDKGVQGASIVGDKGVQGASIVGDKGPIGDKGATGPAATSSGAVLTPIRSAALSLTAAFSGSSTKVTYSNLLHDEGGFFNAANPGVLKIPADYGSNAWVQPSYYFESNSSTGQRIASFVQVVSDVETILTGYRNLLVANGRKGTSFRGAWLLAVPGTEFYVAYSNGTGARAMGIGAWFQIEVRKAV